ncbi:MAG TPA: GTPase HflX [Rhabdochlamydiaceae bacterium]|nr:GTPase HflX [Rhabdochlamydiaceae bacterium]
MLTENSFKNAKTALLVGAYLATRDKEACDDNLTELQRLCETYGLEAVARVSCPIKKIDAGSFLGSGKLDELLSQANELNADIIVFDEEITPNQQRNLEQFFKRPAIDRTELIIEVFAQRAQTREARLQIELAKVKYQLPRLKRMWTHLSRQAGSGGSGGGGGGYLRGAGELQIELDRRMLRKRMTQLQKEIEEVEKQRETQRRQRIRTGIPTFAIVGYTNAGKSTLLNALTNASVLVEDKLFATLDTTTRKFILPNRQEILLIDTVGFIRKIPHTLVAAFKSTLEEAVHTDILLHLVDVSNPMAELQAEATNHVLKELNANNPMITVLNKIDACIIPGIAHKFRIKYPKTVPISALTKEGFDRLIELMIEEIAALRKTVRLRIPQSHYALVSELIREGKVLQCDYEENDILIHVEVPSRLEPKVKPFVYEST